MRKLRWPHLLLAITLIFLLSGCTASEPVPAERPPTDIPESESFQSAYQLYPDEDDREAYRVWNLDDPEVQAMRDFLAEHEAAVAAAEPAWWLKEPDSLAQYFVDKLVGASEEIIPYQETFFLPTQPGEAVYLIIVGDYLDDSVWGDKIRVELRSHDQLWEIAWAGHMWRCRRGGPELEQMWHTTLCP